MKAAICSHASGAIAAEHDGEEAVSQRYKPGAVSTDSSFAGRDAQTHQVAQSGFIRGVQCGLVPSQKRLPVAHASGRIS